jgi:competence protein ComEC
MGRRIKTVMDAAGVSTIDAFVDTHYHEDHFSGIDDPVDLHVPVLEAYDRGDKACCVPASKKNQQNFKDYLRTVGEDAIALRRGNTIDLEPLVAVRTIASGGVVIGEQNPVPGVDENDLSVARLVTFGDFRAFFGGDIERPTEAKIADRDLVMNVDLYKADHHGSDTSSSAAFMADLAPP